METKVIFIGDPHFQLSNLLDVNIFIPKIVELCSKTKDLDFVVIGGDILHNHEKIHTVVLNKAYELIRLLSEITKVYVLVGNHDYISNSQFLTNNHWMNAIKFWKNVKIIDSTEYIEINNKIFTFVPYVYPGRFIEALNVVEEEVWKNSSCIFAHQEFKGCKMGSIVSIEGDEWDVDFPQVISGHIHSKQKIQENIYYPGSSLQIAFGENENNTVCVLKFNDIMELEEIDLELPKKRIIYVNIEDFEELEINKSKYDNVKIAVKGTYEEFKALKKTSKYKKVIKDNMKIQFKSTEKIDQSKFDIKDNDNTVSYKNFLEILSEKIQIENNNSLTNLYKKLCI